MDPLANAESILENFSNSYGNNVKHFRELAALLNTAVSSNIKNEFMDLIFTARYVNGLKKILGNRTIGSDEFIQKTFEEFKKNLEKVIAQLKLIITVAPPEERNHFERTFFDLNERSIPNTMELVDDLSSFKHFLNVTSYKI